MQLTVKNICKAYADRKVLDNLSFQFKVGVNYLVAPNGSGKSTLLKLIAGIEEKDKGDIFYNEKAIRFSSYGSYVPDKMTMYPFVTGKEFLDLVSTAKHIINDNDFILGLLDKLNIKQYLDTPFSAMSLGTQKKFFVIAGFLGKFSCLLMDEPSNAIDKSSLEIIIEHLREISTDKVLIIATHDQFLLSKLSGEHIKFY